MHASGGRGLGGARGCRRKKKRKRKLRGGGGGGSPASDPDPTPAAAWSTGPASQRQLAGGSAPSPRTEGAADTARLGNARECTGHSRRARPLPLSLLSRPPPTQTTHKLKAQGDDQEKGKDDGQEQDGRLQDGLGAAVAPPHLARASFFFSFFYIYLRLSGQVTREAGHPGGRGRPLGWAPFGGQARAGGAGWRKQRT